MIEFSPRTRERAIHETRSVDLLVIGGGITGAGIALDAAARGIDTLLVEKRDFVSGTSSKSTKLIHGGLRYLRQMELGLVREAAIERALLMKLAPHLIEEVPFLIPAASRLKRAALGAGLWLYELLGGFRSHRHETVSKQRAQELVPTLHPHLQEGGLIYYDAKADDCRLTLHVLKKAVELGARALNYIEVLDFIRERGRAVGCRLRDGLTGYEFEVRARKIVAAVGVWSDRILSMLDARHAPFMRPTKGIHLVVPRRLLRNETAVLVPSPEDKRIIFAVPWGEFNIIGTTDTDYVDSLEHPRAESDDIRYLIKLAAQTFSVSLRPSDIVSTYAGLRPLLATPAAEHPSKASRDYTIVDTEAGVSLIAGGKLTTYRRMAAKMVDRVLKHLGRRPRKCATHKIPLFACATSQSHLARTYGSEYERILASGDGLERIDESLPNVIAEVDYAVRHESACAVSDFLSRRTRAILFSADQGRGAAPAVAERMARTLGWTRRRQDQQVAAYEDEIKAHQAR